MRAGSGEEKGENWGRLVHTATRSLCSSHGDQTAAGIPASPTALASKGKQRGSSRVRPRRPSSDACPDFNLPSTPGLFMLLRRSFRIMTSEPGETLSSRLAAAVLPAAAFTPFKSVRMVDWIAGLEGKRFVGSLEGQRFKLGLLQERSARIRRRGSVVVILGKFEGNSLQVRLRPPLFVLAFLGVYAVAVSAALALSFHGPANTPAVHLLLAGGLVVPVAIVVWSFRREANAAEQALREVTAGGAVGSRNGGS